MVVNKFYRCRKCGVKVSPTYLAQHWLNMHFSLMYSIVEYETQTVFELDPATGETKQSEGKTRDEIEKELGYKV